jgi:hypothetical protein
MSVLPGGLQRKRGPLRFVPGAPGTLSAVSRRRGSPACAERADSVQLHLVAVASAGR